jgi:hypothetical protein
MNRQKHVSQLLIRTVAVQEMAKETKRIATGEDKHWAKRLHEDAKVVRESAMLLVSAQARLASLGMDNIDLPQQTVHSHVVNLEIRLERLLERVVMEPFNVHDRKRIDESLDESQSYDEAAMRAEEEKAWVEREKAEVTSEMLDEAIAMNKAKDHQKAHHELWQQDASKVVADLARDFFGIRQ